MRRAKGSGGRVVAEPVGQILRAREKKARRIKELSLSFVVAIFDELLIEDELEQDMDRHPSPRQEEFALLFLNNLGLHEVTFSK
ncbi:hypothetical protein NDU88_002434 [Pleurodeles waltl]|uniref:Uncharacterized protein n=1 Tax=Pleurodeles waltl TaxID=8319 RepID=A0AAV7RDC2_PLEWA|nr:hypothetical protein NDU88_002434 [Pleurodeles waltl]